MSPGSGGRALLLIYLRRTARTLLTIQGLTLLSFVGKVICKILNNRLVQCLDKQGVCMRERLALELTEVAWMMTLNEIVQGRFK